MKRFDPGLEAAKPGDSPMEEHRHHLDRLIGLQAPPSNAHGLTGVVWPPLVGRIVSFVVDPKPLREVLKTAAKSGMSAGDVLRALEMLHAAGLLLWNR